MLIPFQIFSGKLAFDDVADDEVVKRVRSGERPNRPGGSKDLGLSDALWEIVQKCWDNSVELRPGMADVLERTRKM